MALSTFVPAPSSKQFAFPVPIIGSQYCVGYPVDLAIVRKFMTTGDFDVIDVQGNVIFKVRGKFLTMHDRRVVLDAAGNPILTLRQKIMSAHDRWQVFRGESAEESDLIFSVRRSSMLQLEAKLQVFLANNKKEDVCDFRVEGSWTERSCVVYEGESSSKIAKMYKKTTIKSVLTGKDNFNVMIDPNIDYAFIVALIVILDGVKSIGSSLSDAVKNTTIYFLT
ncbi:protein LURP-one-related 15-like [Corylus avellana]|uniref:protein LURP-one-related 15-like n=1 Tax=Corylus avellana TaxID=13451 RepID=UPI001E2040B8|nr:protein LURP-one-related 15-like [Corylus avellana]